MDLARNELDAKILRLADHCSPEEISRELGGALSPARVAAHTKALLKSQDWLTDAEQDAIVTWKMRRILAKLEEQYMDLDNAKAQLAALKLIGERLDKRRAATQLDLTTYSETVGRQLGRVVDLSLTYMKGALRDEVDPDRWDELVQEAVLMAREKIEEKQVEG
ncbi:hypothetical protein [Microbacterium sp. zg-YB36]|uniref:hypothetical protein n=1 Tax=Microbacterium sp. zg-YB36 TaxID=2969407 RepID=UPI00214CE67E|nr:hypothetical protein [Microbacterium sp. zg-YB36]MDL5351205.1 hypothetical protein [Microbacterium sp. zg-YB36]